MSITEAERAGTNDRPSAADRDTTEPSDTHHRPGVAETTGRLESGTPVEVRSTLEHRWSRGFEVIEVTERGYRVRRLSDNVDLPGSIRADDVRKERRRGTWWY
jgi:hypothetical protein